MWQPEHKAQGNYMWIVTALETWDCKSNNILKVNSKAEQRYRADNTTYDLLENSQNWEKLLYT